MRPGVPWSVKGIDDEARQAAKLAARKAGMTLGQWLNTVIKETADEDVSRDQQHAPPTRAEQGQQSREFTSVRDNIQTSSTSRSASTDQDISRRLDSLAGQLSMLSAARPRPAATRYAEPPHTPEPDNLEIQALIDRVEAYERRSAEEMNRVHARLENVTDKLASAAQPAQAMPQKPEDVPGFSALESAMRNIVDHIEASEISTRETLKSIQQRMAEMAARATEAANDQVSSSAPAISTLEQRINELTARLDKSRSDTSRELQEFVQGKVNQLSERIDAVRHSTDAVVGQAQAAAVQAARGEGQQLEQRLKTLIGELQGNQQPDAAVQRIYAEIESLNQRLDDVNVNAVPASDVSALRSTVEQLTGQLAQSQDLVPVQELEARLAEMGQRLEQLDTSSLSPQLADLEHRVEAMDAQLRETMANPGDQASANRFADQMNSVGERLSATESKLNHLNTIEQAIEQLYRSVEETRALADQSAEDAAQRMAEQIMAGGAQVAGDTLGVPSAELQALENGLTAVKASAEAADQRTQETLEAVHDTLEQIIDKLAELEQRPVTAPQVSAAAEPTPEMLVASEFATALPPQESATAVTPEQSDDPFAQDFAQQTAGLEPAPVMEEPPAYATEDQAPEQQQPEMTAGGFVPGSGQQILEAAPQPSIAPQQPPPAQPATSGNDVHEDFIAAARRAAQNAATQRSSILGGLSGLTSRAPAPNEPEKAPGKLSSLFSRSFRRSDSDRFAGDIPAQATDEDGESSTSNRRLHLILAGLVLLAAVSAYSFSDAGKRLFTATSPEDASPQMAQLQDAQDTHSTLTTAALTSVRQDAERAGNSSSIEPVTEIPAVQAAGDALVALPKIETVTASVEPVLPDVALEDSEQPQAAAVFSNTVDQSALSTINAAFSSTGSDGSSLPAALGSKELLDAAVSGNPNAQFVVASRYLEGKAVERDFSQAAEWYRKAAESGLAPAQYRLGTLYERGNGVAKNVATARSWYERAAAGNNVKAMHNLAVIYANNANGEGQFDKAAKWFRAAADHGLKDSLYNLAVLYERGLGISQDTKAAYFWFGIAARHGDVDSKAKIATLSSFLTSAQKSETDAQIAKWAPQKPDAQGNFVAISDPAWKVAVAAPAAPSEGDDALTGLTEQQLVLKAQQLLSGMGYDVGPIDGVMGSRTANAVRLFQLQTGAPVNGTVSAELVKLLAARQS